MLTAVDVEDDVIAHYVERAPLPPQAVLLIVACPAEPPFPFARSAGPARTDVPEPARAPAPTAHAADPTDATIILADLTPLVPIAGTRIVVDGAMLLRAQ